MHVRYITIAGDAFGQGSFMRLLLLLHAIRSRPVGDRFLPHVCVIHPRQFLFVSIPYGLVRSFLTTGTSNKTIEPPGALASLGFADRKARDRRAGSTRVSRYERGTLGLLVFQTFLKFFCKSNIFYQLCSALTGEMFRRTFSEHCVHFFQWNAFGLRV